MESQSSSGPSQGQSPRLPVPASVMRNTHTLSQEQKRVLGKRIMQDGRRSGTEVQAW